MNGPCVICLTECKTDVAVSDRCEHSFCFECIMAWSEGIHEHTMGSVLLLVTDQKEPQQLFKQLGYWTSYLKIVLIPD